MAVNRVLIQNKGFFLSMKEALTGNMSPLDVPFMLPLSVNPKAAARKKFMQSNFFAAFGEQIWCSQYPPTTFYAHDNILS